MPEKERAKSKSKTSKLNEAGEADIETLEKSLTEEKEKAEKYLACWQRAEADFSNYKRHTEQERTETGNYMNIRLITNILPVLDDFERAFTTLSVKSADPNWIDGFRLIQRKLQGVLDAQGMTEIKAMGEPFDPCIHEAVAHHEGEEGIVIAEIQKGYKLNDKVLRPTLAVVGKGKEEKVEEITEQ